MTARPFRTFEGLPPEVEAVLEAAKAVVGYFREAAVMAVLTVAVEALREPPVKRYVVELRVPKVGEPYVNTYGEVVRLTEADFSTVRAVIVDETEARP